MARATTGAGCVRGSRREERAPYSARDDRNGLRARLAEGGALFLEALLSLKNC